MNLQIATPHTALCRELVAQQRWRAVTLKSRIKIANRLQAVIAVHLGYQPSMAEKERERYFDKATKAIKSPDDYGLDDRAKALIDASMLGIRSLEKHQKELEKEMESLAKQLPVAEWVKKPQQRGFGILFLAMVVGECGDLGCYSGPWKLWRRMACAPWTYDGQTFMGATWRQGKRGSLPAEEWSAYGYCKRRRSIAYLIGHNLMMQNRMPNGKPGPYRKRYEEAKASMKIKHPDYRPIDCDRHGLLLAAKLLLKNLWLEWNGK